MLEVGIIISALISGLCIVGSSVKTSSYKEKVVLCSEIEDPASRDACLSKVIKEDGTQSKPVKELIKAPIKSVPESNQE